MLGEQIGVTPQPVAGAFNLDDDGVWSKRSSSAVAMTGLPKISPFGKAAGGREDHSTLFVAGVDQLDEQVATARETGRQPISSTTDRDRLQ